MKLADGSRNTASLLQMEEPCEVPDGVLAHFLHRHVSQIREGLRCLANIGRLVALAAMRDRGKIRAIGFGEETIERKLCGNRTQVVRLFEGNGTREGDQKSPVEKPDCILTSAAETVENPAQA